MNSRFRSIRPVDYPPRDQFSYNMDPFPLSDIPTSNITSILAKMPFLEASRMRATCRQIEETFAKSSRLSLHVPRDTALRVAIRPFRDQNRVYHENLRGEVYVNRTRMEWFHTSCGKGSCLFANSRIVLAKDVIQPYNLEYAHFDNVVVFIMGPWPSGPSPVIKPEFLSIFKEAKIRKCRWLNYTVQTEIEGFDLIMWARLFKPSGVVWRPLAGTSNVMSFDVFRELIDTGVKYVISESCDWIPPDYASVLLKYQGVRIYNVVESHLPSMESLVQRLLDDVTSTVLECQLPVYNKDNFLTPGEIAALGLEQNRVGWIGDRKNRLAFFVAMSEYFVTLTESREPDGTFQRRSSPYFISRKIPKTDISKFIEYWVDDFLPANIPVDASGIYEYVEENRDDYEMIREKLETIFAHTSTFDSSLNLIFDQ